MKKIFFLIYLLVSLLEVEAQEVVGKWRLLPQIENDIEATAEIEFKPDNTLICLFNFEYSFGQEFPGVVLCVKSSLNGKYECFGKALSMDYDTNSINSKSFIDYSPDCTFTNDQRKKISEMLAADFPKYKQEFEPKMKVFLSAGTYRQILMINYEKMIIGHVERGSEELFRIIPESDLKEAKQKRENERNARKQNYLKHQEESTAKDSIDDGVVSVAINQIIKKQDLEKIGINHKGNQVSHDVNNNIIETKDRDPIFDVVDVNPQFDGGKESLSQFLKKNLKYPEKAKLDGIQGRTIVQFIVNRDGFIEDAIVLRSTSPELSAEALRLVNSMPKWIPGEVDGKKVRTRFVLPLIFSIPEDIEVK